MTALFQEVLSTVVGEAASLDSVSGLCGRPEADGGRLQFYKELYESLRVWVEQTRHMTLLCNCLDITCEAYPSGTPHAETLCFYLQHCLYFLSVLCRKPPLHIIRTVAELEAHILYFLRQWVPLRPRNKESIEDAPPHRHCLCPIEKTTRRRVCSLSGWPEEGVPEVSPSELELFKQWTVGVWN